MPYNKGPAAADGNLHLVAGLHDKEAEGAVEVVDLPKVCETGAGAEDIRLAGHHEGEAIGGEPVVVVVFRDVERERLVRHTEAACFEEVELFPELWHLRTEL